jgi:hypothetical protein
VRIGLDFDNTIACYDGVFHAAGVARGLIPASLSTDKTSVRDHLRATGNEDAWTELQGYVYGARMDLVSVYPGCADFASAARAAGHEVFIVSHKTRTPYLGPGYDLHAAAWGFLERHRLGLPGGVYFELTRAAKLARIQVLALDVFVDDLPEVLAEPAFPVGCRALLFDPNGHWAERPFGGRHMERHACWDDIGAALLGQA